MPEIIAALIGAAVTLTIFLLDKWVNRRKPNLGKTEPRSVNHFWDSLSNDVFIIIGSDSMCGTPGTDHAPLSPRDMKASMVIMAYLARRYPEKRIIPITVYSEGWQAFLQEGTDLIVLGGFVVNVEFSRYRSLYEKNFRLKMGRLCKPGMKSIYQLGLDESKVKNPEILYKDPIALERLSIDLVGVDYALVANVRGDVYGSNRRLIAVSGIRGNGTLGAAQLLTREGKGKRELDVILKEEVGDRDNIEMVIQTEAINGNISRSRIVEALINGETEYSNNAGLLQPCQVDQACDECEFGETSFSKDELQHPLADLSRKTVFIFDLDDTLIDTYGQLIIPLEIEAAKRMASINSAYVNPEELAANIMDLRVNAPSELEKDKCDLFNRMDEKALDARREVFKNADGGKVFMDPLVRRILERLAKRFTLYLLTEGDSRFQKQKLDSLDLKAIFNNPITVRPGLDSKDSAVMSILNNHSLQPSSVCVVGNRLDKEISVGNRLGMGTIWVRHGEGSGMVPSQETGNPDLIVNSILELSRLAKD